MDFGDLTKSCEPFLKLIKDRNVAEMDKVENVQARMIIYCLKNNLSDLEFFMKWLSSWCKYMPGAGSYHFTDIKNNKTFDIYRKYGFEPCNLHEDAITESQWDYVLSIGYVTQEEYDCRCA
jgi:hypothetical protein